jgi:hypothetical protein
LQVETLAGVGIPRFVLTKHSQRGKYKIDPSRPISVGFFSFIPVAHFRLNFDNNQPVSIEYLVPLMYTKKYATLEKEVKKDAKEKYIWWRVPNMIGGEIIWEFAMCDDALRVLFDSILVYLVEFLVSFVDLTQVPYYKEISRRQVPVRCLGILRKVLDYAVQQGSSILSDHHAKTSFLSTRTAISETFPSAAATTTTTPWE